VILLEKNISESRWDEERAWAAALMGEIFEGRGEYLISANWYERSLEMHPGVLAALRLARVCFHRGKWEDCVRAYERAMRNKDKPQMLDGGLVYEDAVRALVASALRKLGRGAEASQIANEVRDRHASSPAAAQLADKLRKDAGRG